MKLIARLLIYLSRKVVEMLVPKNTEGPPKIWANYATEGAIHIIPLNDSRIHFIPPAEQGHGSCPCFPDCHVRQCPHGDVIIVKHQAYDGREAVEQAETIMRDLAEMEKKKCLP